MISKKKCIAEAIEIAHLLRVGAFLESTAPLAKLFEEVGQDIKALEPLQVALFAQITVGLAEAKKAKDWLGMADWLEYDFVKWIEAEVGLQP